MNTLDKLISFLYCITIACLLASCAVEPYRSPEEQAAQDLATAKQTCRNVKEMTWEQKEALRKAYGVEPGFYINGKKVDCDEIDSKGLK